MRWVSVFLRIMKGKLIFMGPGMRSRQATILIKEQPFGRESPQLIIMILFKELIF
jgi:hypothetical protein